MPASPIEALFDRYRMPLYGFLLRSCGEPAEAEELTQEVFRRAVEAERRYDERGEGRAWLFRIARNLLIDRARRAAPRPRAVPFEAAHEPAAGPPQVLRLELRQALEALPAADREALLLGEVGGLTYAEIAAATESTVAAVRSRVFRARQSLRQTMGAGAGPASVRKGEVR